MTTHPLALLFVVATLAALVAPLAPHVGKGGLLKNFLVFFVGLFAVMGFLAAFGKAFHDFIFD